jgi:hypothetical protein
MREGPIRTAALLPFQIKLPFVDSSPINQILASKIQQLKAIGMTNQEIAKRMKNRKKDLKKMARPPLGAYQLGFEPGTNRLLPVPHK